MSSEKIPLVFYRTLTGNEPVREWLTGLPEDDRKVVGRDLQPLQFRWPVGMPLARPLMKGLSEVRTALPSNRIARVLFSWSVVGSASCTASSRRRRGRPRLTWTLRSRA